MQDKSAMPGTSELAIQLRCHRAENIGEDAFGKKRIKYRTRYETAWSKTLDPEEWLRLAEKAIEQEGKQELLKRIENHCRKTCAWLRKESDLHEYAVDALCHRSYEHWDGFTRGEGEKTW